MLYEVYDTLSWLNLWNKFKNLLIIHDHFFDLDKTVSRDL